MHTITFHDTQLHLQEHPQYEFLITNKEVALGYGIVQKTLNDHRSNHKDELIEGKHWLRLEVQTKGGKQKVIHWTKRGIVRLGFFIKSKQAKEFRDWAEDYIINDALPQCDIKELQKTILRQNELLAQREQQQPNKNFVALLNDHNKLEVDNYKLREENANLKKTLIDFSNRYHSIVLEADNKVEAIRGELERMTNRFQLLPNLTNDGNNLNTETQAGHSYW